MNSDDFNNHVEAQINMCKAVLIDKAQEYATEDRLHNFRVAARLQGTNPIRALSGMMAKHTISIYDMCDDPDSHQLGSWEEKITDHINYLLLLKALVSEQPRRNPSPPSITDIPPTPLIKEGTEEKVVYREHGKDYVRTDPNDIWGMKNRKKDV